MLNNIEDLLNLFEDKEVRRIILSSYYLSQDNNKELSDIVFEKFFILKKMYPNINIVIDRKSTEPSNYKSIENTIYLNGSFNELVFLHELTHLISYDDSRFILPMEYEKFKSNILQSKERCSLLFSFVDLCKLKRQEILNNIEITNKQNNIIDKNSLNISNNSSDAEIQLSILLELEDIVDALVSGEAHDTGLHYSKNDNHIVQKSEKTGGHGREYFATTGNEFEEILANYQSILLLDPNNKLLDLLKTILGQDFVAFLNDRCEQINSTKIIKNNINYNINK